jgi:hypothetical protein
MNVHAIKFAMTIIVYAILHQTKYVLLACAVISVLLAKMNI